MATGSSFRDRAGVAVASGILVGALAGSVESLLLDSSAGGGTRLLYGLWVYGAIGSVLGLVLAAAWAGARAVGILGSANGFFPMSISFHTSAFLLFLVGYRLNIRSAVPPALSAKGLMVNGALVGVVLGLGFGLAFLLRRIPSRIWDAALRRVNAASSVLIAIPFLLVLSFAGFGLFVDLRGRVAVGGGLEDGAGARPNVIVLVVDALRKDHVSGYGYERRTTLALDHLMDESVTFENAFAQSSWTIPSVASLFTGVGPASHGVLASGDRLPADRVTVAEKLGDAGYACGAFLGNAVIDIGGGFDRGFHFRHPPPKPFWCFRLETALERIVIRFQRSGFFWGGVVLGEAERWIEKNRARPFFAYIHLIEPHSPYEPPPPFDTLFDPEFDGRPRRQPPLERARADRGFRDWEALPPGIASIPDRQRHNMIALYDGEIAHTDRLIDRFLKKLQALGLYRDTLLLVTADHGEEFYEHGGWFHGQSLYDELLRVPLIVKLPDQQKAGTRRRDNVAGVDLFPTVLYAAGLPVPQQCEGVNILGVSGEREGILFPERPPFLYAAVEGPWKLIMKIDSGGRDLRLFNLDADPGELDNAAERHPDLRDRLAGMLEGRAAGVEASTHGRSAEDLDAYQREQLKALGYIQ